MEKMPGEGKRDGTGILFLNITTPDRGKNKVKKSQLSKEHEPGRCLLGGKSTVGWGGSDGEKRRGGLWSKHLGQDRQKVTKKRDLRTSRELILGKFWSCKGGTGGRG